MNNFFKYAVLVSQTIFFSAYITALSACFSNVAGTDEQTNTVADQDLPSSSSQPATQPSGTITDEQTTSATSTTPTISSSSIANSTSSQGYSIPDPTKPGSSASALSPSQSPSSVNSATSGQNQNIEFFINKLKDVNVLTSESTIPDGSDIGYSPSEPGGTSTSAPAATNKQETLSAESGTITLTTSQSSERIVCEKDDEESSSYYVTKDGAFVTKAFATTNSTDKESFEKDCATEGGKLTNSELRQLLCEIDISRSASPDNDGNSYTDPYWEAYAFSVIADCR